MSIKRVLLGGASSFLGALLYSRWPFLLLISLGCFAFGITDGWLSYSAHLQNIPLNGIVVFPTHANYARQTSVHSEYLSTLILYSVLWLAGGVTLLVAWRLANRSAGKNQE